MIAEEKKKEKEAEEKKESSQTYWTMNSLGKIKVSLTPIVDGVMISE